MVLIDRVFENQGMSSRIVMMIHDALLGEAPEEEAQQPRDILKDQMEQAVEMPLVPLDVNIE